MFSDFGYPGYAGTVSCLESTVKQRGKAVAAFVRGTAEDWRNCLADPTPANALIKKDNPAMSDEQLAYSVGKLRQSGVVTGGDAGRLGIGTITDARAKASYDFMVSANSSTRPGSNSRRPTPQSSCVIEGSALNRWRACARHSSAMAALGISVRREPA